MTWPDNGMMVYEEIPNQRYYVWFVKIRNWVFQDLIDAFKSCFPYPAALYDGVAKTWSVASDRVNLMAFAQANRLNLRVVNHQVYRDHCVWARSQQAQSQTGGASATTGSAYTYISAGGSSWRVFRTSSGGQQAPPPPPPPPAYDPDLSELGLSPSASLEEAERKYRELVREHHPDKGGDLLTIQQINAAMTRIRARKS